METEKQQQKEKPNSESHLGKLADQGGFHQLLHQAATGHVHKAAPAGAHQPCREPVEDATPTVAPSPSPAPLTGGLPPLASPLPAGPQEDKSNLKKILLDTVRKSLLPCNSYLASLIPSISGLGHASYPILSFSWWWESTKSLFLPSSLQHKCQQEHVSCHAPEASFWGGLTKQIETLNPSFVNPDVQKLLEILITKRVELKTWKEKEKGGSVVKQWCPDDHMSSLGTMQKLLGAKQTTATPQSFWNMNNKPEQLAGPQPFSSPKVLEDRLKQKCSQLFWGLPSLHSESLVATALVSSRSSSLQIPSVLFNGISNSLPVLIQDQISSRFSHAPPLFCCGMQPQPSTLNLPQPQAHLAPSVPIRPPYLPSQRRTCGVPCPSSQKKTRFFIPKEIQQLEWPLLPKQQERGKTLPAMMKRSPKFFSQEPPQLLEDNQAFQADRSVSTFQGDFIVFNLQKQQLQRRLNRDKQQGNLPHRIQLSLELIWPQDEFPGVSHAQGKQRLSRPFVFKGKSSQATRRTRSRYPRNSHRKGQARSQLEKNFGKGLRQCLKRTPTDLSRVSARYPVKFLGTNSEKELQRPLIRTLKSDPGKCLARGPGKKHLEKILKVHLHRKWGQINEGLIPVSVRRSWFMANHALPKSHPHMEIRNLASSNDQKPSVNTSHELSFLSPYTQQRLETHIIRFRVRHRWDLPLQGSEPIDLKLCETQPLSLSQSPFPCSATFVSGAHSKAKFYKFLGKPQPHPGGKGITEESIPTSGSPLPVPSPTREEIQQALGGTSPGDGHESSETPLSGQEGRSPSRTSTLSLINRTPQSKTVMGAKKDNLEPSQSLVMARNELKEESGGRASPDKVAILEMKFKSQPPRAKVAMEAMEVEKTPAWKVILRPSVLANNQTIYVDLRRSGSPSTRKSPSPPTELLAQDPKEPSLKTKVSKFEVQEKAESENQPQGHTTGVLLQDSPRDILLPDFATGMFVQDRDTNVILQDTQTNALLAADTLTTYKSPFCSQRERASGDTPASPVPHDLRSSGPSSEGQQEPSVPKVEESCESQTKSDSTDETEDQKSPRPEKHEEGFAEPSGIRASQASGTGHPPQVRGTGESFGSKYLQLMPARQIFPESHFRKRMRNFLQYLNLNRKGKGLEDPLQKCTSASVPAQSQVPVRSRSVTDSRAVEAQTIVTAVGRILVEKLGLQQGIRASGINQHKEFQAPKIFISLSSDPQFKESETENEQNFAIV
ncbi:spermatogenesis-associated protein 31E1-like [Ursus maritimus]|uniref:Spermatogenesis-associated protein 31E1-like n=1 Tax=Ursus maritimus TaxID=29073 RepID=A0A384C316_URSMA|nr:spermatogenesis-associated protein 31E1-like [Ursus maritimus]